MFTVGLSFGAHAFYSNAWGRATLRLPLSDKWTTDAEVQYRRQSGFEGSTPFDYPLLFSYRQWAHYRFPSRRVTVSLSPFAWFRGNPTIRKNADYDAPTSDEYRFSAAIAGEARFASKLGIEYRTAFEYRLLTGQDIVRVRERLSFKYKISDKWLLVPSGELFLNGTGTDRNHLLDQWRATADLSHDMLDNRLSVSVGYMYLSRLPGSASKTIDEHDLVVKVLYNLKRGGH